MPAIAIRDLRRTYTSTTGLFAQHKVTREALRGVSLDVEAGELFGLLGPNGAGKTYFGLAILSFRLFLDRARLKGSLDYQ